MPYINPKFQNGDLMVTLKWLGHAAWLVKFSKATVLIDPFLTQNPTAAMKESEIDNVNYIVITHEHMDHLGDAFTISKRTGAKIVGMFELSQLGKEQGVPEENFIGMNKGNLTQFGDISIGLTHADHSGNECGALVSGDGKTIYHAGDTALFGDMKLIGELYHPDVALLPIGGFFTMSPKEAAVAAKLIGAEYTIPMHYNTFPPIQQDPEKFKALVTEGSTVKVMNPGEELTLQ